MPERYYGNLALRPERKPEEPAKRRAPSPASAREPRRRSIPVGEKLLYLFTVFLFVAVSSVVIYRYAGLYQLNREIQDVTARYEQQVEEAKELQREVEKLKDPGRIKEIARQNGLIQNDEQPITLSPAGSRTDAASKP
ncbi:MULTISPECIES: cell division protein FtsL [Cohnella]|jgi:cell division protein FtsL|uniref:cell division protein FtsL n=1 Tax=Cohnella TaxID=329857 RepID=UPI00037F5DE4|nr:MULTISPECIES: cell division protein FtsL [Cohnella]REK67022.1 MAG: cell division protein FtsL [Cohnella sp.]